MTTLMTSFIAIVLFGMVMIATINYADSLGISSTSDGMAVTQRLNSVAELVGQMEVSRGSRPRSVDELKEGGLPDPVARSPGTLNVVCSQDEACSSMSICMELPNTTENLAAAKIAVSRLNAGRESGSSFLSGQCGNKDADLDASAANAVVTLRL